jgi:type IV secretion system protein TrbH
MNRWFRFDLLCVAALMTGCAVGPDSSYVTPLQQPADAETLANDMAAFVAMRLPAASSTVALDPTPSGQAGNAVTPALVAALRHLGFGVAEEARTAPAGAHRLRYLVTALDNGDLVRLTLDDSAEGSRFFVRNTAGGLQSGGPFMVTQAEAAR